MAITDYIDFVNNYLTKNGMIGNAANINRAPDQLKKEIDEVKKIVDNNNSAISDLATNVYVNTIDAQNVKLTGNQTIDGVKTFTASQRGTITTDNDGSLDLNITNNFSVTPTGTFALTFTNISEGQSGQILLDNSGGHIITSDTNTKVDAKFLSTVSNAGVYVLGYFSSGTNVYVYNTGAME